MRFQLALLFTGTVFSGLLGAAGLDTRVAEAAKRGDTPTLEKLLKEGADANAALADKTTALHWAVEYDDAALVDSLLKGGAKADGKDRFGHSPLHYAIVNGNRAIASRLLAGGADPKEADANGDTLLMSAAREGAADVMTALLEKGADIHSADNSGVTPLMWAARSAKINALKLLIAKGANVNAATKAGKMPARRPPGAGGGSHGTGIVRGGWPDRGYQGEAPGAMTALLFAARDGALEVVRELIASKADVNQADVNGISPLNMAISNHHLAVAKFLLTSGADPKSMDLWGRTPLWSAVEIRNRDMGRAQEKMDRAGALELIQMLVDKGVDVNARIKEVPPVRRFVLPLGDLSWVDFTGQTAFLRSALAGDLTVMRLLVKAGADPNIATNSNTTALMAAAGVNWVVAQTYTESKEALLEAVKMCIELGGDVNTKNTMGLTAVMGAANRGSDDILQFLVDRGAKITVKDNEGRTPYAWAEGVFLATNAPEAKPSTMALIKKLTEAGK